MHRNKVLYDHFYSKKCTCFAALAAGWALNDGVIKKSKYF
jgi:hypothetical protein